LDAERTGFKTGSRMQKGTTGITEGKYVKKKGGVGGGPGGGGNGGMAKGTRKNVIQRKGLGGDREKGLKKRGEGGAGRNGKTVVVKGGRPAGEH